MSRGTKQRSFRVEDDLWEAAKQTAEARGDNLSDVIRHALSVYVGVNLGPADVWGEGWDRGFAGRIQS